MRPTLKWFAEQMETKLQENDYKHGWENCTTSYLIGRLDEELNELKAGLVKGSPSQIVAEAADVANIAMMIADNNKGQHE
jgi:hypothetical protein